MLPVLMLEAVTWNAAQRLDEVLASALVQELLSKRWEWEYSADLNGKVARSWHV